MAYPNIEAILEEGGDITVGRVGLSGDAGGSQGESFVVLLQQLVSQQRIRSTSS